MYATPKVKFVFDRRKRASKTTNEFFNVEPMLHTLDWNFNPSGALDLLIIVGASSLVLWIREIYRLFKK